MQMFMRFDVSPYDIILLDSMLHFYSRDLVKETNWVKANNRKYEKKVQSGLTV